MSDEIKKKKRKLDLKNELLRYKGWRNGGEKNK